MKIKNVQQFRPIVIEITFTSPNEIIALNEALEYSSKNFDSNDYIRYLTHEIEKLKRKVEDEV